MVEGPTSHWRPVSATSSAKVLQQELRTALDAVGAAMQGRLTDLAGDCLARAGAVHLLLARKRRQRNRRPH